MATDCSSRSKDVCQICGQETSYRCLHCAKPVCNRSKSCSVAAPEEERGWKPGHAVSICTPGTKRKPCIGEQSATPKGSNTTKAKAKQTCSATSQKKRKCLDISDREKVKVLEFANQNPNLRSKKISGPFRNRQDADSSNTEKQVGDHRRLCQQ